MDNKINFPLEWGSWIYWIAATVLAFLINDGTQLFIPNESVFASLYNLFLVGLVIAFFQWLFVLRPRIQIAHNWIWCTAIGWSAGWLIGKFSGSLIVSLLIHGIILGLFQWAFFVRKLYSKSFLWVIVNAICLPFAYGLSWFVIFPLLFENYNGALSGPLDSAIRGALYGALTGAMMIWLSHTPHLEIDTVVSNIQ